MDSSITTTESAMPAPPLQLLARLSLEASSSEEALDNPHAVLIGDDTASIGLRGRFVHRGWVKNMGQGHLEIEKDQTLISP